MCATPSKDPTVPTSQLRFGRGISWGLGSEGLFWLRLGCSWCFEEGLRGPEAVVTNPADKVSKHGFLSAVGPIADQRILAHPQLSRSLSSLTPLPYSTSTHNYPVFLRFKKPLPLLASHGQCVQVSGVQGCKATS